MKALWAVALWALSFAAQAATVEVEIYDRASGSTLPVHGFEGKAYVAGEPVHEYELVLRNRSGGRVLAVTSVDGVNVITGETASPDQSGYVLAPYGSVTISGWRKSLEEVAAFYFTKHSNSYASRTGRPFDVGVIGVAVFDEKQRCCKWFGGREEDSLGDRAPEPAASAAPEAQSRRAESPKLGTGHGRREQSGASYTEFERASDSPQSIVAVYYDTRANLVARGILPAPREYARRQPRPFPGAFVPDP